MIAANHNPHSKAQDESDIRRLIAKWSKALEAKDLDGLTADYAPDAVLFDAIPPYKTVGAEKIRKVWETCLPYFPATFKSEHRDIVVHVDGNVALVHCLDHFLPTPADHPCGMTWMRVTVCYRRSMGNGRSSMSTSPYPSIRWTIKRGRSLTQMSWARHPMKNAKPSREIHAADLL